MRFFLLITGIFTLLSILTPSGSRGQFAILTPAGTSSVCENTTITFTATIRTTGFAATNHKWYFKPTTGQLREISNSDKYTIPPGRGNGNNYTTTLTFTATAEDTGEYYASILNNQAEPRFSNTAVLAVTPAPAATFTTSRNQVETNQNVTFTYTGNASAGATYDWNFDGGMAAAATNPAGPYTVQWNTVGSKTITLAVTQNGCTGTATATVVVVADTGSVYTWQGGQSSNWNTAANWSPNGVPGADDEVIIEAGTFQPVLTQNKSIRNLRMNAGSFDMRNSTRLTVNGTTRFTGGTINSLGIINIDSDNMYFEGSVFNGNINLTKSGSLAEDNLSAGGSTFNGPTIITNNTPALLQLGSTTGDVFNGNVSFVNQGTSQINVSYNSASTFAGNLAVNGLEVTFGAGGGTVVFTGNNRQTITNTAEGEITFNRVTLNKSANQVVLNTPVAIATALTLNSGRIASSAANLLTFNAGATVTGASPASYVAGPVKRFGPGPFIFPLGREGLYRPLAINPNGNANGAFTASYFPVSSTGAGSHNAKEATIDDLSTCEYWRLTRVAGNATTPVTISQNTNNCGIDASAELLVARWNGSQWVNQGNNNAGGTIATGTVTTAEALASFGAFALGSSVVEDPLPVELVDFTAVAQPNEVLLAWSTASEQDNQGFEVECSANGVNFTKIAFVEGAGTSQTLRQYATTDAAPLPGTSYYRLKQLDYSGKTAYSKIVSVRYAPPGYAVQVSPNPVASTATLRLNLPAAQTCFITLADAAGRVVYQTKVQASATDKIPLPLTGYSKGMYYLTVRGANQLLYQGKLLKE